MSETEPRKTLVIRFDVSALTERQIDSLAFAASVQGESYRDAEEPEDNYPDVPVLGHEVEVEVDTRPGAS